jgi:hypothetical protein
LSFQRLPRGTVAGIDPIRLVEPLQTPRLQTGPLRRVEQSRTGDGQRFRDAIRKRDAPDHVDAERRACEAFEGET